MSATNTNYELDFSGKCPPSAQEGRARADENANESWKAIFDACILAAARRLPELTSDDVLAEMESLGHSPMTHTLNAIGGAMVRAMHNGVLSPTNRVKRSARPEKHGNRQNVWQSNYYAGARQ